MFQKCTTTGSALFQDGRLFQSKPMYITNGVYKSTAFDILYMIYFGILYVQSRSYMCYCELVYGELFVIFKRYKIMKHELKIRILLSMKMSCLKNMRKYDINYCAITVFIRICINILTLSVITVVVFVAV